ncbi:hypothetical protein DIPPA_00437 [Diplonema papillatum]|nr:hypothetical protein DIPPA_00437 [Diplonema papillatum]
MGRSAHGARPESHVGQPVGLPVCQSDAEPRKYTETQRHNNYQNIESNEPVTDKNYGLSPARCRSYHNQQTSDLDDHNGHGSARRSSKAHTRAENPSFRSTFSLAHEPEEAAKAMQARMTKPDFVNEPRTGPIRSVGKGVTDAGIKFGQVIP